MKKLLNKAFVFITSAILLTTCFFGCTPPDNGGDNPPPAETGIKNVILVIGDGMGMGHIKAGQLFQDKDVYNFINWSNTRVDTANATATVTDSAAGGTAIATGTLTNNDYVGIAPDGVTELETIMDIAKKLNKSTGIVTNDVIYGATPASFSAHSTSRDNVEEIIESQIESSNVDILCGAYSDECADYEYEIEESGYTYCDNISRVGTELGKHYWSLESFGGTDKIQPLKDVVEKAIKVLEKDSDGFVLVVEEAYIDKYSHNKDFTNTAKSVQILNDTVNYILSWISNRKDTAVLVTADHDTCGLDATTENLPGYTKTTGMSMGDLYYLFQTSGHTSEKVGLFVYGATPKYEDFATYKRNDLIKNTETYQILKSLIENKK